jgi:polyhydroxybutyrate depolymerase
MSRSYRVYAPAARLARPALLIVLHGWMGSGAEIEARTNYRFDRLADRDGYVVAYPDAVAGQWHSGHPAETATDDDVGFLSALIDSLSRTYGVDPHRIYVTGLSNGASMTYRLACERPGRIAAVAPVSGGLARALMQACAQASRRPIPLLLIHGTADPVVPFDSGELEGNLAYWIRRNGCATTNPAITYLPNADPGDGTRTRVEHYAACRNGADVILYAIEGGGHHWPNGDEPFRLEPRGNVPRDFDAADAIWSFLKAHRLQ